MRINFLILLIAFLLITVSSAAQDETEAVPVCSQPFSTKFDEFPFTNLNDAQERIDLFGLQIKNQNARGIVIGYGGKHTESGQGRKIAWDVGWSIPDYKIQVYRILYNNRLGRRTSRYS